MEYGYAMASYWGAFLPLHVRRQGGPEGANNGQGQGVTVAMDNVASDRSCVQADSTSEKCPLVDQEMTRSTESLFEDPQVPIQPPIAWFWPSICAFILCCPLGYAAVVSIYQAQEAYERGDRKETEKLKSNAKVFIVLSLIMFVCAATLFWAKFKYT